MKTPLYESSSGALMSLMFAPTRSFVFCDLYTFTLSSGPVLRYSTSDTDITYKDKATNNSFVWSAHAVRFDQEKSKAVAHWKVGLDVDTWSVVVSPRDQGLLALTGTAPDKIGSQNFLPALAGGALDGAIVTVDRAYFSAWPSYQTAPITPVGVLPIFAGRVAEVDVGRSAAVININSHLELMSQQMPRNLYQAGCIHTLFDAGCTLNPANFVQQGVVATGSTQNSIISTVPSPKGSGTYALGRIVMTSGQNLGFARAVRSWANRTMVLVAPFPFTVAVGDTFVAYPGCSKSMAACTQFNNLLNFGGTPFIPMPEVLTA